MRIVLVAAAAVALAFTVGSAAAADLRPITAAPPPAIAAQPPPPPPTFQWSGFYVGGSLGLNFDTPPVTFDTYALGAVAGYNFVRGRVLLGLEAQVGTYPAATAPYVLVGPRVGFIVAERLLVYGQAELGYFFGSPPVFWMAGIGAEVGVGDRLSLYLETKALSFFGGGFLDVQVETGVNIHLGR